MSFDYLPLADFHLVLKLFPKLRHLALSTSTFDMNFASATIWYEFITNNLLELEKFQFYVQVSGKSCIVQYSLVHINCNIHFCVEAMLLYAIHHLNSFSYSTKIIVNGLRVRLLWITTMLLSHRLWKSTLIHNLHVMENIIQSFTAKKDT